jgi:hypothetical protein
LKPLFRLHLISGACFLFFLLLAFGSLDDKKQGSSRSSTPPPQKKAEEQSPPPQKKTTPAKPRTMILPERVSGVFTGYHPEDALRTQWGDLPVFHSQWSISVNQGSFSVIKHKILSSRYRGPDRENSFRIKKISLVHKDDASSLFRLDISWTNPSLAEHGLDSKESFVFLIESQKSSTTNEYSLVLKPSQESDLGFFHRTQAVTLTRSQ